MIENKLKEIRRSRNKTTKEVAEHLKIKISVYEKYENSDISKTPVDIIVMLSKYYGITTDYILGLKENKANTINLQLDKLDIDIISLALKSRIEYLEGMLLLQEYRKENDPELVKLKVLLRETKRIQEITSYEGQPVFFK